MLSLPWFIPHSPVYEFPEDIRAPGVPVCIGDHAHHGMVQGPVLV